MSTTETTRLIVPSELAVNDLEAERDEIVRNLPHTD